MPFVNPITVTILVPEQDFFYWPCMSGEMYAPTLSAPNGVAQYSSNGLYPVIHLSTSLTPAPGALWPVAPSWKYTVDAFAGMTITFRVNLGASNTNNGGYIDFHNSNADRITFGVGIGTIVRLGSVNNTLSGVGQQNVWYSFIITVDASSYATVIMNGVTVLTSQASSLGLAALQIAGQCNKPGAGTGTFDIAQLQVTYT